MGKNEGSGGLLYHVRMGLSPHAMHRTIHKISLQFNGTGLMKKGICGEKREKKE